MLHSTQDHRIFVLFQFLCLQQQDKYMKYHVYMSETYIHHKNKNEKKNVIGHQIIC